MTDTWRGVKRCIIIIIFCRGCFCALHPLLPGTTGILCPPPPPPVATPLTLHCIDCSRYSCCQVCPSVSALLTVCAHDRSPSIATRIFAFPPGVAVTRRRVGISRDLHVDGWSCAPVAAAAASRTSSKRDPESVARRPPRVVGPDLRRCDSATHGK